MLVQGMDGEARRTSTCGHSMAQPVHSVDRPRTMHSNECSRERKAFPPKCIGFIKKIAFFCFQPNIQLLEFLPFDIKSETRKLYNFCRRLARTPRARPLGRSLLSTPVSPQLCLRGTRIRFYLLPRCSGTVSCLSADRGYARPVYPCTSVALPRVADRRGDTMILLPRYADIAQNVSEDRGYASPLAARRGYSDE
jgi:hypothetical protein